jgi:hypothetical protein
MPRPDPVPTPAPTPGPTAARFKLILKWSALLSVVVAAIAVLAVQHGDPELHIHMLIATGLGVFLTVMLGTGLMSLIFLSNSSGHDASVADHQDEQ